MASYCRDCSHAGSWYPSGQSELRKMLDTFLDDGKDAVVNARGPPKILISPHAGLRFSGATAAHGFACLREAADTIKRVIILGPSHRFYLDTCALSSASSMDTPLGALAVDEDAVAQLAATGKFARVGRDDDEAEHSLELQLPFLRHVLPGDDVRVVPIMVGDCSSRKMASFARLLDPLVADPATAVLVSSDFCHWGERFRFQPFRKAPVIWEAIEKMDMRGVQLIAEAFAKGDDGSAFETYLGETENTICGRNPIRLALALARVPERRMRLLQYAQSERVTDARASSVSYVSAVVE